MKKLIKKIAIIITLILSIQYSSVFANVAKIGETKYIERGEKGFYSIQYWNDTYQNWYYVTYSRTYYTDDNGEKRIAYCNSPDLNGIGWIPGEYDGYDATIQSQLTDNKLWRVFKNGYPYVTPEELGVETEDDAYIATKQSAYFIIRGRSEDEVYDYFRPGQQSIDGQDLEETKRRGQKVVDAIYKLVSIGNNGSDTIGSVRIEKQGELIKDEENDLTYQEFKVINNNKEEKVEITNIQNAPSESYICNEQGELQNVFNGGETFRLVIKNKNIEKDYNLRIEYKATSKNYPVFCAKSTIENTQDYLLSVEKYDDEYGNIELQIDAKKSNLELLKIDEDTKQPIEGVKFNIKYLKGENIGKYTTDKNGIIKLNNIYPGKLIITEIETPDEYILNTTPREVEIGYNTTVKIEIDNKEAKPEIEVQKKGPETAIEEEEIKYNFKITNRGNVGLEDFTWYDFLPYDKAKITKIATGTFNQDLEYNIYYKTNKCNSYLLLKENLQTKYNNFIDLSEVHLEQDESITETKFEFGNVDVGFSSVENPFFYLKIKNIQEDEETITNTTKIEGKYKSTSLFSEDKVETKIKKKKIIEQKKLPRTGF